MPIKVAIYEDNSPLRESLSHLVLGDISFEFLGAYPNCNTILENCQKNCPDVILMDIDLPGISGIEATALVRDEFPDINVMMLTVFEDKELIFDALCVGATGYLLKKSSAVQILEAIKELHNGGSPMSSEIARKILEFFSEEKLQLKKQENAYNLSSREYDILKCLTNGDSYKMVAAACNISVGTVYTHINNIYKKLHVNSKSEAVIKAIRERLI